MLWFLVFLGWDGEENCSFLMQTSMLLKVRSSLQLPAWGSDSLQDSWCTAAGTSRIDQVGCTVCASQGPGQECSVYIMNASDHLLFNYINICQRLLKII